MSGLVEIIVGCARCGSDMYREECGNCGGDGCTAPGALYEEDPLWYDEDDSEPCPDCHGTGGWYVCLADAAWCEANPLPGREKVERGTVMEVEVSP